MNDNSIAILFRKMMLSMLAEQGRGDVLVADSFQPDNQGRIEGAVLYYVELMDVPYAAQTTKTTTNASTGETVTTSVQNWRVTYQVQGFAPIDNNDMGSMRPTDLVKLAVMLINSPIFRAELQRNEMGLEKITALNTTQFTNDRDQFESGPTFDFTLSYKRRIIQRTHALKSTELAIHRI